MALENIGFWQIIVDGVALCLCGVSIACLIKLRKNMRGRSADAKGSGERDQAFEDVLMQMVKQSEETFQTVTEALRKECQFLQELMGERPVMHQQPVIANVASLSDASRKRKKPGSSPNKRRKHPEQGSGSDDRYSEATHLARLGHNGKEIREKVSLPANEIELIVDLNKLRGEPCSVQ